MADTVTSSFPLQFIEQNKPVGFLDMNAKWTCHICGIKESDTGCTHLLQWLNRNTGQQMRDALAQLHVDGH